MTIDESLFPTDAGPEERLSWTSLMQGRASDPAGSAWVSANAGSGKTHVLTQRVIRLMLAGSRPSAILCLTYTKAAASEMSNRVFERLSHWATMADAALAEEIRSIEGSLPSTARLRQARRLFARALETPGGLKIQTIHAFCEALLHQFPLEANVAGHFQVLDDAGSAALLSEARRRLLTATAAGGDMALADAFGRVLGLADDTGLDSLIGEIIARRSALQAFLAIAARDGVDETLRRAFAIENDSTEDSIVAGFWPLAGLVGNDLVSYLDAALNHGGKTVRETARLLQFASEATDPIIRLGHIRSAFFKADGGIKSEKSFHDKPVREIVPDIGEIVALAMARIGELSEQLSRVRLLEATRAALILAEKLNGDYESLKKQRSLLDFDDLIERTAALLKKSEIGPWVHFKLDQGIDHILVDEAQDTSPRQWEIIKSLADDFFAGKSAREADRTFFAVGDEKQSIYSFQGARPERFASERDATRKQVEAAGARFHPVRLPLSFRSTQDVLSAVDQVFSFAAHSGGLNVDGEGIVHVSSRSGQAGLVDVWDIIAPAERLADDGDWTAPYDALSEKAPANQLAQRITATIQSMVGKQTIATKTGLRLIEAGDILVLVRKRDAFVGALTRALNGLGTIPVAGADRLVLASHIAVQDLMALARFVLLQEDDLSLAALLKSPLLGLGEDDVFRLAARRGATQTVWDHIRERADSDEALKPVVARLQGWIELSRQYRVHDFFARILGAEGGRRAFLSRLGNEVSDVLDEFLNFALSREASSVPGLQCFVATLESEPPTIKREQDKERNEVRIMTVHAAKGLEAPVVFVVDGGGAAFNHSHVDRLRMMPGAGIDIPAWFVNKELGGALKTVDDERLKRLAEEEYRRLLYVAMTRAADRLIICGFRGQREIAGTWHAMATASLTADEKRCRPRQYSVGALVWEGHEWRMGDEAGGQAFAQAEIQTRPQVLVPDSLLKPLPPEKRLPRPLNPSGAHVFIDETEGDLLVGSALFSDRQTTGHPALRGQIIHRLLQLLAGFAPDQRHEMAMRYLGRAVASWKEDDRRRIADSVAAVMQAPEVAGLFDHHGRAEVSIMGTIKLAGKDHAITGRIDRLTVTPKAVFIADFKTNRVVPGRPGEIPKAHVAQLALYREVLKPLYPERNIACVLIYTEGPMYLQLSDRQLENALVAISAK